MENSLPILPLFSKGFNNKYDVQGPLAVVNLKELKIHINFCHIRRLNAGRALNYPYYVKAGSQKVF